MARRRHRGTSVQIQWDTAEFDTNASAYQRKAEDIPYRIAQYWAPQMEAEAKRNAAWTDRTSNARQGLRGRPYQQKPGSAIIYLVHGMEYGVFLELNYQGRYSIIMPTVEGFYPQIKRMIRDVVR